MRPTDRPGTGTAGFDALERRAGARALLSTPLLVRDRHPDQLALVRRHAAALQQSFAALLGYRLIIESSFARLIKPGLSADTAARPALRTGGQPFTPRAYAYLALVAGALLALPGEQVLLSALIEQVRADAVTAGLDVDTSHPETRQLVAAIALLLDWGVLSETDGTVAGYATRAQEALLDVHRALLPHLLTGSLADIPSPAGLIHADETDAGAEQPRRGLRRKLVENPLVRREQLTDAERDVLSRERTELTRQLSEAFGLTLEVRAEGALAYDVDGELTDLPFPGPGTVKHVALLLLDALTDDLHAGADHSVTVNGQQVPGVLALWQLVEDNIAHLINRYGASFGASHRADRAGLQAQAVALLDALSLTRSTPDGLMLHPACARYRPDPHQAPAHTRALRRLANADTVNLLEPPSLFADQEPS